MTPEQVRRLALEALTAVGVNEDDLYIPEVDPHDTEEGYWVSIEYFIPKSSVE